MISFIAEDEKFIYHPALEPEWHSYYIMRSPKSVNIALKLDPSEWVKPN